MVKNQLAEALFRRILRAHALVDCVACFQSATLVFSSTNEKFRIYIVLPLLPGFDNVNAVQAVLYFIMRSITKGEQSLFKRLESRGKQQTDCASLVHYKPLFSRYTTR